MNCFCSTDFLIPENCDMEKWATIACDQYTAQPEYWKTVREFIGDCPSTLHTFFPEAELAVAGKNGYQIYGENMTDYLNRGILREYPNSYIYVKRTLNNGDIRNGILGVIDLERYDYEPKESTKIFATEATVLQRVPPRVELRKDAPLEFSHTVIFCDDPNMELIEPLENKCGQFENLYAFDLMFGGGRICGYRIDGKEAEELEERIRAYEVNNMYLVGDGNHSLVTAKLTYEALKRTNPDTDWCCHPARYAMVELENIHQSAMRFEPIYRIAICAEPQALIKDFGEMDDPDGVGIIWIRGNEEGTVRLHVDDGELPIEALQRFLDQWITANSCVIDYIHGADSVKQLAQEPNTVGFLLPNMDKRILFPYILSGKVMPRKSFSIGHATEKRYYLEGRKIK